MSSSKRGILERLDASEVIVGDGGFSFCMERRGYGLPISLPTSSRPFSSTLLEDKNLIQQKTLTTNEELHKLAAYAQTH
ncbi:hypothetical protein pdam_00015008 [Pocillopora damicornis]|uniref:Uncharacterized protein n=1 Tax=Pocillopora damicornis TaxID=46731 RepID=A0A3M6T5D9_POCDA|nr:hypothetical protein pdam_00015008 [Pocillopora damicornis]